MRLFQKILQLTSALVIVTTVAVPATPASALTYKAIQDSLTNKAWFDPKEEACGTGVSDVKLTGSENAQKAFQYFVQRGLSPEQSAGIVGNLQAESGVNPGSQEKNPVGGGPGGIGIAQWTGGRRVAIENFAAATGNPQILYDLRFQLDYLYDQEFLKGYADVLAELRAATTVFAASNVILHKFEIPLVIIRGIPSEVARLEAYRAGLGEKILLLYGKEVGAILPAGGGGSCASGSAAGFAGFPLKTTKARMAALNGGCLTAPAMCRGGHPYAAYDILADTGTAVLSVFAGTVSSITTDRCPGRMVSITTTNPHVTISYLHMSVSKTLVTEGQAVTAGQQIGWVGTLGEGCTVPHLHIDAVPGDRRPGCSRLDCPTENAKQFSAGDTLISLGKSLYDTYLKLP